MSKISDHYNEYLQSLIQELVFEKLIIDGKARECSNLIFSLL